MAAAKTVYQLPQSHNSRVPRHGVVTLYGYGIRVNVDCGHLIIEDGIGTDRRSLRLSRVGHGLRRLVIVGSDGFVSLAALRWLADQKASFVMLERNGEVLCVTGPVRPSDARLRRAQAIAGQSGLAIRIARELISRKLDGQEQVARYKLLATETADAISRYRTELVTADTPAQIRLVESRAASVYWSAWHNLSINFPKKDGVRTPHHWTRFGARVSPLTGSPRHAVNPPNAMLSYLYAILESESRLAAAALGLDPSLGVLHVDAPSRDSLACDLMEAVRPQTVDVFVLDWLTRQTLNRDWFYEQSDGNCRLMSSLTVRLAETAPTWARAVAPVAEWVAQELWNSTRKPAQREHVLPTRLTQRRRTEGRGLDFRPHAITPEHIPQVCSSCAGQTKRGWQCPKCGRETAGKKLAELAKLGRIISQSAESQKSRSETQQQHEAAKRAWRSAPQPAWPDEQAYAQEIQPRLAAVTISRLSSVLGVSEPYAADIRAGRRRPHPRHWRSLAQLVGYGNRCSP